MTRASQFLPAAILIMIAGLVLGGCSSGLAEVRYVNRTNNHEVLTLKHAMSMKTQIIRTFHGQFFGTYTVKAEAGTIFGTFTGDGGGFKFKSEDGKTESAKIKSDGSFDYANATWQPGPEFREKGLKAVAFSKDGAAQ